MAHLDFASLAKSAGVSEKPSAGGSGIGGSPAGLYSQCPSTQPDQFCVIYSGRGEQDRSAADSDATARSSAQRVKTGASVLLGCQCGAHTIVASDHTSTSEACAYAKVRPSGASYSKRPAWSQKTAALMVAGWATLPQSARVARANSPEGRRNGAPIKPVIVKVAERKALPKPTPVSRVTGQLNAPATPEAAAS